MKRAILLLSLFATPALAKREAPPPLVCPDATKPVLFLSPMGEPFRPKGDDDDPVKRWFDRADRNRDGKLTAGEMALDADRFFATLDKDGNGELLPDDVHGYEEDVAPEIRLYQRRPEPAADAKKPEDEKAKGKSRPDPRKGGARPPLPGYDGAVGAGRYAFLNIPNPVVAADGDFNRAISAREFNAAAVRRFAELDPQQTKALSFDQLPKTPAQRVANAACLERAKEKGKDKRR